MSDLECSPVVAGGCKQCPHELVALGVGLRLAQGCFQGGAQLIPGAAVKQMPRQESSKRSAGRSAGVRVPAECRRCEWAKRRSGAVKPGRRTSARRTAQEGGRQCSAQRRCRRRCRGKLCSRRSSGVTGGMGADLVAGAHAAPGPRNRDAMGGAKSRRGRPVMTRTAGKLKLKQACWVTLALVA